MNRNAFAGPNGPTGGRVQLGQVAIYCRVSTDDQSCERQERDLRAFAKRSGHEIVGFNWDRLPSTAVSAAIFRERASGAKNDRAERKMVMALAQARKIDAILVTELSRWGRSTQDLVQTLDDLHNWKVSVLAQTGLSFDLTAVSGDMTRSDQRSPLAEQQSASANALVRLVRAFARAAARSSVVAGLIKSQVTVAPSPKSAGGRTMLEPLCNTRSAQGIARGRSAPADAVAQTSRYLRGGALPSRGGKAFR
jgi:DNA invertase Pin-like site-specific DNA recombinase